MIHGIWEVFLSLLGRQDADDEEASWFVPSPLDLSVRIGHGGPDDDVQRELNTVSERARDLEELPEH